MTYYLSTIDKWLDATFAHESAAHDAAQKYADKSGRTVTVWLLGLGGRWINKGVHHA